MRFQHKVAIITGAASGIGRATAQRLYDEGASVALIDRNEEALAAAAAALPDQLRVWVAAVIAFLASNGASYVTSQALPVDGGNTASLNLPGMKV
jgi:NAD(P)-dependent dehydrogenase (short-subunit alcohol dehydrogenase family)